MGITYGLLSKSLQVSTQEVILEYLLVPFPLVKHALRVPVIMLFFLKGTSMEAGDMPGQQAIAVVDFQPSWSLITFNFIFNSVT